MNKKGFTLIEILAVIVILGVVMLIGGVSVTGIKSKIDKNMFETKLDLVISSAKTWGQDNREQLPTYKTVGVLLGDGYLKSDEEMLVEDYGDCPSRNRYDSGKKCNVVINNTNGEPINYIQVKMFLENNRVYACIDEARNNIDSVDLNKLLGNIDDYSKYFCE